MSYKEWGNATWYLIHTICFKLKPKYENNCHLILQEIFNICENLPCPDCREHAMQTIQRTNYNIVKTREQLISYFWMFHNKVNEELDKPLISREESDALYKLSNTDNIVNYFSRIMSANMRIERAMLGTYRRQQAIKKFMNFYKVNREWFAP